MVLPHSQEDSIGEHYGEGDPDSEVLFKQCSAVMPATTIDRRIRRQGGNPYHLTEAATKNAAAAEAPREHRGHRRRGARKSRSRSGRRTVRPGGRRRRRLTRVVAAAATAAVEVWTTAEAAETVSMCRSSSRSKRRNAEAGAAAAAGALRSRLRLRPRPVSPGRRPHQRGAWVRCGHGCERGDGGGTTRPIAHVGDLATIG